MTAPETSEIYALLAQNQGQIRGYILSLTADVHVTNDVLQETNLVICKKSADFKLGTNFAAWACKIAYFEVLRYRATTKREKLVFDDSLTEQLAEDATAQCENYTARKSALKHCLQQLGAHNQKLVFQRYYENIPLGTIAQERNSTPNALSQLLYRLRQQLMNCIDQTIVDTRKL
ncbi:MAG: RNA polymerase sigma-70 factor (ECF subfamily) [Lentimonas sp.]|jgi:RNA polymerase sigma-70 factor (ECF subfamily)